MLHIVTIYRCGMGSNVILKMGTEKALKDLDIEARLEASDTTTGKGATRTAGLILIGKELAYLAQDIDKPIVQLTGFVNEQEIEDELREYCEAGGIKQRL